MSIACGSPSHPNSPSDPTNGEESAREEADANPLVDRASAGGGGGGGSQYFLITPKLLHGLDYVEGMRVLCIASGEYMPTEQRGVDFRACVELARGVRGLVAVG